jgi:Flp pilus assembly protein TadG
VGWRVKWKSRRHHDEAGVALVEFALILPIFMAIALGTLSAGQAYSAKLDLAHAAREGARYGATIRANQTFSSGNWAANVKQLVIDRAAGDLSGTGAVICVSLVQGSPGVVVGPATAPHPTSNAQSNYTTQANGSSPCIANETYPVTSSDPGRRVQISVSKPSKLEVMLYSIQLSVTAKATSHSESNS